MSLQAMSITQVNEYIRAMMNKDSLLCSLSVRGEISNYKVYPSGHHYFTLKDENAALRCVMFKNNAIRLRCKLENGTKIIATGQISVYLRDGAYQLICSTITLEGAGDLHVALEQLKARLEAQGLFDDAHKKPLPAYPGVIGVVTSSAGAVIHDIIRVLRKRYPLTKVLLLPVRVQGVEAPAEIVAAIRYANRFQLADLLIVGRGGGSIEDLWAFNDELVARAIYQSRIPVISAVGHQSDTTIADYVADLSAATPSNAAEFAVPDQDALRQTLDTISSTMVTALSRQLKSARKHLDILKSSPSLQSPTVYIRQRRKDLLYTQERLVAVQNRKLAINRQSFVSLTSKLDAMSPLKVLTRGYAMVGKADGSVVRSVLQIEPGDTVTVTVSDGTLVASVTDRKEKRNESEESNV